MAAMSADCGKPPGYSLGESVGTFKKQISKISLWFKQTLSRCFSKKFILTGQVSQKKMFPTERFNLSVTDGPSLNPLTDCGEQKHSTCSGTVKLIPRSLVAITETLVKVMQTQTRTHTHAHKLFLISLVAITETPITLTLAPAALGGLASVESSVNVEAGLHDARAHYLIRSCDPSLLTRAVYVAY